MLVAVQGLGNLLVVAVLVAPAATARRLTRRLGPMMAVAVGARRARPALAGLYLSYYAGVAAGAAIAGDGALYALGRRRGRLVCARRSGRERRAGLVGRPATARTRPI